MNQIFKIPQQAFMRMFLLLAGIVISAAGSATVIVLNVGSEPSTAFFQSLARILNITVGQAASIILVLALIVVILMDRGKIGIGTLVQAMGFGAANDLFISILAPLSFTQWTFWQRFALLPIGAIVMGLGLGIYQGAGLGAGPIDAFNLMMSERLKLSIRTWRMYFDGAMFCLAVILKGNIHFGTALSLLTIGPTMAVAMKLCQQFLAKRAAKA